jgi:CspA family cold shock protein
METGKVKWFNTTKGFGFITPDDGSRDLFVHYSDVVMSGYRNLEEDQRVAYECVDGPKGPCAKDVKSLDEAGEASGADNSAAESEDDA